MPAQRTDEPDKWVELRDFSPGIHNRTMRTGNTSVPAPLGAAQETNTYRCIALPSGGLAPLPKQTQAYPGPSLDTHANITDGPHIVGFIANGQITGAISQNRLDELLFGVEYLYNNAGTIQRRFKWIVLSDLGATNTTFAIKQLTSAQPTPGATFWGMTQSISRMLPTGSADFTQPGYPVVAGAWAVVGGGFDKGVWVFPSPAAPGAMGVLVISETLGANSLPAMKVHAHQGRLVTFNDIFYSHGQVGAVNVFQEVDEQINFTDPPNSPALLAQNQVFVQEYPTGYCAYGSISAGELFLIKRRGGGVIVSGDIAYPTITRLPGVVSGGRIQSKAASTPYGMFYAAGDMGAYVWRGSDTSQKVSQNLEDNFFIHPDTTSYLAQQVFFEEWGDWVCVSNNWLYDTVTNSWWRLEDPSVRQYWGFSRSFDSRFMYGCVASYGAAGTTIIVDWDRQTPALTYSWQSHPIPQSVDRTLNVLEGVLLAQGSGTVTVTLTAGDGTTQSIVYTVSNTARPLKQWQRFGSLSGDSIITRIESSGASAAPVVYSLNLGYKEGVQAA